MGGGVPSAPCRPVYLNGLCPSPDGKAAQRGFCPTHQITAFFLLLFASSTPPFFAVWVLERVSEP